MTGREGPPSVKPKIELHKGVVDMGKVNGTMASIVTILTLLAKKRFP